MATSSGQKSMRNRSPRRGQLLRRNRKHRERRNFPDGPGLVQVKAERRFQGREREFVDPERSIQRIGPEAIDDLLSSQNRSGLGSSQQFVTAEGDKIDPLTDGILYPGFRFEAERA